MNKALASAALAALSLSSFATVLGAGDLAIVGYNSTNPDQLAVVALTEIESGTEFTVTDYGWRNDGTLRVGGEGYFTVTLGQNVSLGQVLFFSSDSNGVTSNVAATIAYDGQPGTPEFAPSAAGDGVHIFQGGFDDTTGAFSATSIYALNADGTGTPANGWQDNATNSNTSALPGQLTDGYTAIGMVRTDGDAGWATEFNDYNYIGIRSGTRDELLTAISFRGNWEGQDGLYQFDTTDFDVVPEPATMTVLGLAALAALRKRKSK